jgi:20S proteasome alpha/beta subunit
MYGTTGLGSDASLLLKNARQEALRHRLIGHREIPCSRLGRRIRELMQGYTQYRALRPFGVCVLLAGYNKDDGFQLLASNPAGVYTLWDAACFGHGENEGQHKLERLYTKEMEINQACELEIGVLGSMTGSTLKLADVEMVVMKGSTSESPEINDLTEEDIRSLLPPTEDQFQPEQMTGVEVDGEGDVSDNE